MNIRLRTLIYSNKVEIENVPIFSCDSCNYSEVFSAIKPELTDLIGKLGRKPKLQRILFHEINELANLMYMASLKEHSHLPIEGMLQERINQLLDLLLLARSLHEDSWAEEIQAKLAQISKHTIST
ncbi:hypothetical protein [Ferviditalea candida]|uniref:Uncharacterized protein n=1 Tax=Ferviditalea candida TaxID=3108399 RepID=A0ABU5ZK95_9BACL|nr:hypothetical protein [Paenibacillaceae bacterium T2]